MASIRIENLSKSFGDTHVLKGVNLEIKEGEFLTLVGASGSGKSTLLRIIAGLEHKTDGEIYIDGEPVSQKRPKDRDLAMVFQSYALYPHMTVRENMQVPLKMKGTAKQRLPFAAHLFSAEVKPWLEGINQRIQSVAEQLQIAHLLARKPGELSGGQQQRVALGRAMVRDPKAFLMDEPLSNLDAKLRVHMRSELSQIHNRLASTFVYVTHDQVEAMTMSDRIALLVEGELLQVADPVTMYDDPVHLKVAEFIGSPKINLIPATVDDHGNFTFAGNVVTKRVLDGTPTAAEVQLAIRPEYVSIVDDSNLSATVVYVENMGSEYIIHCQADWAQGTLAIKEQHRVMTVAPNVGERINVHVREGKFLCFDMHGARLPLVKVKKAAAEEVRCA